VNVLLDTFVEQLLNFTKFPLFRVERNNFHVSDAFYVPLGLLQYPVQRISVYSPVQLSNYSDHRRFGLENTFYRKVEGN